MLTRIKIFPVSNNKQDDIYRNKNSSAFLQKIPGHHHTFPWLSMTLAVFHDFPGLENGLTKFHDFPWLSRNSGHPGTVSSSSKHFFAIIGRTKEGFTVILLVISIKEDHWFYSYTQEYTTDDCPLYLCTENDFLNYKSK